MRLAKITYTSTAHGKPFTDSAVITVTNRDTAITTLEKFCEVVCDKYKDKSKELPFNEFVRNLVVLKWEDA